MTLQTHNNHPYNNAFPDDTLRLTRTTFPVLEWLKELDAIGDKLEVPPEVQTNQQFVGYVERINVFPILFRGFIQTPEEQDFECIFFEGNIAWIGKDCKGIYRYFTKTKKANNAVGYSIFNIIESFLTTVNGDRDIVYGKKFLEVRRMLCLLLKVDYQQFQWEREQLEKYCRNGIIVQHILEGKEDGLPLLSKQKEVLVVLRRLYESGIKLLRNEENSYSGEALFYVRKEELADSVGLTVYEVRNALNVLSNMGLVINVFSDDPNLSPALFKKLNTPKRKSPFTLYLIPNYTTDLLASAEQILQSKRNKK